MISFFLLLTITPSSLPQTKESIKKQNLPRQNYSPVFCDLKGSLYYKWLEPGQTIPASGSLELHIGKMKTFSRKFIWPGIVFRDSSCSRFANPMQQAV